MHHAYSGSDGIEGRLKIHFLAVYQDISFISASLADHVHAEEDLHKSGFSRSVLSAEAQDLALVKGEINVGQDLISEKLFFNVLYLQ